MNKERPKILLSITTVLAVWMVLMPVQAVFAQTRSLPRSGFYNYSSGGGPLPSAGGMHLQEGQDRPKNAPAGVYDPGEPKLNHKLVRWEARFMPLKVWISPGKKLVEEPISVINAQRPQEVLRLLRSDPALNSLSGCTNWDPEMNNAVKAGIEQWKEMERLGLFSFVFVDDPGVANIFLFWTDKFTGDESAGGVSTAGNTAAVLYDAGEVHAKEQSLGQPVQGTPVIIELQAKSNAYEKLQASAAHEFGHALGIKEHSPFNDDLMCVNGISKFLSPSDKATIRWLYHQQPQYIMLPPVLPRSTAAPQPAEMSAASTRAESEPGTARPAPGGYRIPIARPSRSFDKAGDDDSFGAKTPAPDSSARQPSKPKDPGKSAQRKTKRSKDESVSTPPAKAETEPAAPPPAHRVTDGY